MQSASRKPSLFRIVQTDYLAVLAVGFPAVAFVMYAVVAYFGFLPGFRGHDPIRGSQGAPLFLYMGLIALVIGIPLLIWRVRSFKALFARSVEVPGRITYVSFFRDRGRVEYSYSYEGKVYQGGNAIMKNARTRNLSRGYEVMVVVDREHPEKALLRDLYV